MPKKIEIVISNEENNVEFYRLTPRLEEYRSYYAERLFIDPKINYSLTNESFKSAHSRRDLELNGRFSNSYKLLCIEVVAAELRHAVNNKIFYSAIVINQG